ncbi:hypothetical protein ACOSQ3_003711 [Xanthoceras sorbifolium]
MVTICQQCGDKGYSVDLINCNKCRDTAVHRYCLDIWPAICEDWYCEDCESKDEKPPTKATINRSENLEPVRAAQSGTKSTKDKQETKVTICQQCGDKGLSAALIYCYKCRVPAVHRYCLDVLPATFKEFVKWYCEDCKSEVSKPFTSHNPISIVHKTHDSNNSETVEAAQCGVRLKENNAVNGLKNKEEKDVSGSLSESEVNCGGNSPCHRLIEMHCSENHKNDQKFRGISSEEEDGSSKTKTSQTAIGKNTSNPEQNCELHSSGEDSNNDKLRRSPSKIPQLGFHDHKQLIVQVLCSENDNEEEDYEQRRQKGPVRDSSSDGEIESVKINNSEGASSPSNISKQSSNLHAKSIIEVQCSENDENLKRKRTMDGDISDERAALKRSCYVLALPMIQPIWNGSLRLSSEEYRTVGGLVAHLSRLACYKVFEEAKLLPALLCLDLLPRYSVWPKSFGNIGPNDDNIALYLFPFNERDGKVYKSLVNDMISQDLAMRGLVKNAELLIFTSRVLPFYSWKFQAEFYLWGVFRGKQASRLPNGEVAM